MNGFKKGRSSKIKATQSAYHTLSDNQSAKETNRCKLAFIAYICPEEIIFYCKGDTQSTQITKQKSYCILLMFLEVIS